MRAAPGLEAPRKKKPDDGPGFSVDRPLPRPNTGGFGKQSVHEMGRDDPLAVDFCLDFPRWCSSLFINCLLHFCRDLPYLLVRSLLRARPCSPCRFPHGARSRGCHPMQAAAGESRSTLPGPSTR